jgi:hypothetical protein
VGAEIQLPLHTAKHVSWHRVLLSQNAFLLACTKAPSGITVLLSLSEAKKLPALGISLLGLRVVGREGDASCNQSGGPQGLGHPLAVLIVSLARTVNSSRAKKSIHFWNCPRLS